MTNDIRYGPLCPIEIKADDDGSGTFAGYGSIFGEVDHGGDSIDPRAFDDTLADIAAKRAPRPKMLRDHWSEKIIGQWTSFATDAKGLKVEGRLFLDDIPLARETHALMKAGELDGLSIGFRTAEDEVVRGDNRRTRIIKKLNLIEISVVPFPMAPNARIDAVKHIQTIRDAERTLREAGVAASFAKLWVRHGFEEAKRRLDDQRDADDGGASAAMDEIAAKLKRLRESIHASP